METDDEIRHLLLDARDHDNRAEACRARVRKLVLQLLSKRDIDSGRSEDSVAKESSFNE